MIATIMHYDPTASTFFEDVRTRVGSLAAREGGGMSLRGTFLSDKGGSRATSSNVRLSSVADSLAVFEKCNFSFLNAQHILQGFWQRTTSSNENGQGICN